MNFAIAIKIEIKEEKNSQTWQAKNDSIYTKQLKDTIQNNFVIELNSADSLELLRLPGIGATFSRRIISYREFLGGFAHVNQLLEVYGISENTLENIKKHLTCINIYII